MDGDGSSSFGSMPLHKAFAKALQRDELSPAEQEFVDQVAEDWRAEETPAVAPADLAAMLADFWKFAERREGSGPQLRLVSGHGADAADLKLDLLQIVQDDVPFLVDSVLGELTDNSFDIEAMFHPVVTLRRDGKGRRGDKGEPRAESMILVMLRPVGEDRRTSLIEGVRATLWDVHAAVDDFPAMLALMQQVAAELETAPARSGGYPPAEYVEFLRWLAAGHFVFLGARTYEYPLEPKGGYMAEEPRYRPEDGLGVLRDAARSVLRRDSEPALLSADLKQYFAQAAPFVVAKSNLRSRVHRRAYMDYVGVRRYGPDGSARGEIRFVGLFTVEAYEEPARQLPLIRLKIERAMDRLGETPSAHTAKRLRSIIETYPRDELFQIDEADLFGAALGILHLHDRPRVRLFARRDPFDRFFSFLLFMPRDRYSTEVRQRAGVILSRACGGRVSAYYPSFSDAPLARVHFIIGVNPGAHPDPDLSAVEAEIAEAVRTWTDRFEATVRDGGVAPGLVADVLARYAGAFPAGYRDRYDATEALADLNVIESLSSGEPIRVRAYRRPQDSPLRFRLKLYRADSSIPLADVLPLLEDMGLKAMVEEGFPITRRLEGDTNSVTWVHDFLVEDERGENLVFAGIKAPFEDAFIAIWTGRTESDGFNRLVLELGISWREAALIRAFAKYRQQSGLDPSQAVQERALSEYSDVARGILELFEAKFAPAGPGPEQRAKKAEAIFSEITAALQDVVSLDDDRVLRRIALLVRAIQRTNFYQPGEDGEPKPYISFKVASRELEDLPAPKPYREIFVWSPHVEGVHLRFGPVARGGLRWSDRRDDFRTEVLGLVKAQQVKNAVIVPVGAKGGFYPKQLPRLGTPDATRTEAVRAYKTFLHGLLDITDNLDAQGAVIRPKDVIVHEGDDPYLVVAADKGTASFSDIANGVAEDYGFWLGDAFASGGSQGYDHKAMGITARGAWEAVKRHFREMGKDIQTEPFTSVGVGDMSGDVFGNGALLSKAMKLVAAFDHRHIFLDPDPDPARSWGERKRLFDLPRSSWEDYDKALISKGGGVFARSAKQVPLSPEIKALLEIEAETLAPSDLVQAILRAPVELLYLGGIGTYVKAAAETHAEVGDKANDSVRIDAVELRCKVVGEGANLGFTQAGRIAYARQGGRINTDAIDNSAGVDTSDHEVNIKILTGQAIRNGELKPEARDTLLAEMTDEVAAHVLAHNYNQTLALTLQEANALSELEAQGRFMLDLEAKGRLDRKVEGLPRAAVIVDLRAAGRGLTRPELAVLTAYGKLELSAEIVASGAPDDPYFARTLRDYFPAPLARFEAEMERHRLRREIIATVLANEVVDKAGPTFAFRLMSAAACDAGALVTAFETARQIFRLDDLWREVDALDLKIPAAVQTSLYLEIARAWRGQTYWLALRAARGQTSVQALIDAYRPTVDALLGKVGDLLSPFEREAVAGACKGFADAGVPAKLARTIASLRPLTGATDIADLAREAGWPVEAVARLYAQVGASFGFDRLRSASAAVTSADAYERTALRGLILELIGEQTERTRAVMQLAGSPEAGASVKAAQAAIAGWIDGRKSVVDRARRTLEDIEQAAEGWTFAKLTIANNAIRQTAA